jgi:hypothetical protein
MNDIRTEIDLEGELVQNMEVKAADLSIAISQIVDVALDWYDLPVADAYRQLTLNELPILPNRPEITTFPKNGTKTYLSVEQGQRVKNHSDNEGITEKECGTKIIGCYATRADELDPGEISEREFKDEFGFTHQQPATDPRNDF